MSMPSRQPGVVWRREALLLLCWLAAGCIAGAVSGAFFLCLLLAVSLYLAMQLLYAWQLHRWLLSGSRQPSEGIGIWREIFVELQRLKQGNRRRKKQLNDIVHEFQASTAALPDGAVVLDRHGRIAWFNQAAAALLALRSPQDIGQRIVNLLRTPGMSEYIDQGAEQIGEMEIPAPGNDEVTVLLRLIPYGNNQRLLIARDISEQKQTDAMRRDFVANASHELRTPLTVLRGYLEMMQDESGGQGELSPWRDPVTEMAGQARRMDRIIDDLLKLARLESEGMQEKQDRIDMAGLIRAQVDNLRGADDAAHRYSLDMDESLGLFGRLGELESVVANLVANAAQYTEAGARIRIGWRRDEQGACLSVSDDGIGIEADDIPRLTERFYRVDPGRSATTGGTGLGLAIVKHCLEHHEAELAITSEPGEGSTFACRFPTQRVVISRAA